MTPVVVETSVAQHIGQLYRQARGCAEDSLRYAIECGRMLAEHKASLKHGEWLPWLEANAGALGFSSDLVNSQRTAQRLMGMAAYTTPASDLDQQQTSDALRELWGHKERTSKAPARVIVKAEPDEAGNSYELVCLIAHTTTRFLESCRDQLADIKNRLDRTDALREGIDQLCATLYDSEDRIKSSADLLSEAKA